MKSKKHRNNKKKQKKKSEKGRLNRNCAESSSRSTHTVYKARNAACLAKTICKLLPTANSIITTAAAAAKATTATRERTTTTTTAGWATNSYFQSSSISINNFNGQAGKQAGRQRGRQAVRQRVRKADDAQWLRHLLHVDPHFARFLPFSTHHSVYSYHLVAPLNV